jgi:multidrug resistance efflux pump
MPGPIVTGARSRKAPAFSIIRRPERFSLAKRRSKRRAILKRRGKTRSPAHDNATRSFDARRQSRNRQWESIVTEIRDYSHLHALEQGLSHERERLARATAPAERRIRQTWIDQREREIAAERRFLGLPAESVETMTDDELLAALQG